MPHRGIGPSHSKEMSHAVVVALGDRDPDPDHHHLVAAHRSRLSSAGEAHRVAIAARMMWDCGSIRKILPTFASFCFNYGNGG